MKSSIRFIWFGVTHKVSAILLSYFKWFMAYVMFRRSLYTPSLYYDTSGLKSATRPSSTTQACTGKSNELHIIRKRNQNRGSRMIKYNAFHNSHLRDWKNIKILKLARLKNTVELRVYPNANFKLCISFMSQSLSVNSTRKRKLAVELMTSHTKGAPSIIKYAHAEMPICRMSLIGLVRMPRLWGTKWYVKF